MAKISFTRTFAIETIKNLGDPDDFGDEGPIEEEDNETLGNELCLSGCIHDEDFGGVYEVVPEGDIDAEARVAITGWPVSLD